MVRTKGTVVNLAIWEKEIPFNPNWITMKESSYKSVLGYAHKDFQAVIANLASGKFSNTLLGTKADISQGAIKPSQMITRKIKLENIVEDGIKALIHDKNNQVKILVDINDK